MMPQHGSFSSAYHSVLAKLVSQDDTVRGVASPNSTAFSKEYRELQCEGFIITNPLNRVVHQPSRGFNLKAAIALTALLISGRQEAQFVAKYNPRATNFADDGRYMIGSHGYRLRHQIYSAIRTLAQDPSSRRAMVSVYGPDDVMRDSKDTPCVATLHFLVRPPRGLDLIVHMRSQSACMVMPYDVFSFTVLQELVARELNMHSGFYYHMANSMHLFESEVPMAYKVLQDQWSDGEGISYAPGSPGYIAERKNISHDWDKYIEDKYDYYTAEVGTESVLPEPGQADKPSRDMPAEASGSGDYDGRQLHSQRGV